MDHALKNLIEGCISGNKKAQEKLYKQFSSFLFGVCLSYSKNRAEAEDIFQDGFVRIYQNLKQFKGDGSFEGWMRRIMVNTALERFRKNNPLHLVEDYFSFDGDIEPDDAISKISADDLMKLIQELSPMYRIVFNLYALEGLSHKEISERLNISEGTSKSNLSRARSILQKKVKALFALPISQING